jgi:NitT/TauT family transport system substrate-binding protein
MNYIAVRGIAAAIAVATGVAFGPRPAAAVELELAYLPILPMAQLLVIEGEGWAKAEGLELKLTRFSSGPAEVQALASGKFDAAYVGIGPTVVARSKGIDLKVVASGCINQVALIARGDFAKNYGGAASPAAAFAAFHKATGHPVKIATLPKGSTPDTVLRYWLEKTAKVAPADYEIVGMGQARVQQALLAGSVDAASILEPILTIVQKRDPGAKILVSGSDLFPNQPGAVVAVRERTIKAKPDAVKKLVALHLRATKFIKEHPEQAAKDIEAMIGKGLVAPDVMLAAVKSPMTQPVADPGIIVDATKALLAFQQSLGVTTKVDLDALFETSFYKAATK